MERTIPFVAASAVGLLGLLSAWSFASQRRCGMCGGANRLGSQTLLSSLISCAGDGWTSRVCLSTEVDIDWPRPLRGGAPLVLTMRGGGRSTSGTCWT